MTIDAIRSTDPRYDLDEIDNPPGRATAKTQAPQQSAEQLQALFIESEHGSMHYPPELFAGSSWAKTPGTFARAAGAPGQSDSLHTPAADRKPETGEPAPAAAATNATEAKAPAKAASGTYGTYTTNPNEVARTNTRPDPKELLAFVKQQWPGISDDAAMTLIAQSSFETNGWKACWNNNLGNVKEPSTDKPHFYLIPLPESLPPAMAEKLVKSGQARYAEPADIKKYGLTAKPGMVRIVITAPTAANRFKPVEKMTDGFQSWISHMKKLADKDPAMKQAIESGDCQAFAKTLQKHGYFTGSESVYAGGMEAC